MYNPLFKDNYVIRSALSLELPRRVSLHAALQSCTEREESKAEKSCSMFSLLIELLLLSLESNHSFQDNMLKLVNLLKDRPIA